MSDKIVTPIGVLMYAQHLQEARDYKGDGNFAYDGKIQFAGQDAVEMFETLDALFRSEVGRGALDVTHPQCYWVGDNKDILEVKLKVKKFGKTREGVEFERTVAIYAPTPEGTFDVLPSDTKIGNGSKAQVMIRPYCWGSGITLQPDAVRILELVEFTGKRSDDPESMKAYHLDQFGDAPVLAKPAPASAPADNGSGGADF